MTMTRKLVVFLGVLVILGIAVYQIVNAINERQLMQKLSNAGIKTQATIKLLWSSEIGIVFHLRDYYVNYDFNASDATGQSTLQHQMQRVSESYYSSLNEGQRIAVRYLKDDPTQVRILGQEQTQFLEVMDYTFPVGLGLCVVLPVSLQGIGWLIQWAKA